MTSNYMVARVTYYFQLLYDDPFSFGGSYTHVPYGSCVIVLDSKLDDNIREWNLVIFNGRVGWLKTRFISFQ